MSNVPVVWEHRCKLCQLAKTHPELFKDIHFQVLEVGSSMNRAMNYANHRIETENINTAKLNNQNFSVHFSSHISLSDKINGELVKINPSSPTLREIAPEVGTFVEDMVRRKIGNEVNDYLNLDHLRAQMMEKLDILDDVVARRNEDGKEFVDLEAMAQYTHLIKEIRSTIVDLNKIRSSKQLMNLVIKSLIERSTFDIVQKLSREYDQVKRDLLEAGVESSIVIRTDQNQRMRLAEIVAQVARQAVADVLRSYKLNIN